jgi:hypothetical protein
VSPEAGAGVAGAGSGLGRPRGFAALSWGGPSDTERTIGVTWEGFSVGSFFSLPAKAAIKVCPRFGCVFSGAFVNGAPKADFFSEL